MITISQYAGPHRESKDWTPARQTKAMDLLRRVNDLTAYLAAQGVPFPINNDTGSGVSGQTYGGFRPQNCPQGAPKSSHKEGEGIDLYDPGNYIDAAITDKLLIQFGLFREHPNKTKGWCHLTTRAPKSGNRTFLP